MLSGVSRKNSHDFEQQIQNAKRSLNFTRNIVLVSSFNVPFDRPNALHLHELIWRGESAGGRRLFSFPQLTVQKRAAESVDAHNACNMPVMQRAEQSRCTGCISATAERAKWKVATLYTILQ